MKWLKYAAVGFAGLFIGWFLNSAQQTEVQPVASASPEQREQQQQIAKSHTQEKQVTQQPTNQETEQPIPVSIKPDVHQHSELIDQLSEQYPDAYQQIQEKQQHSTFRDMFNVVAKNDPSYAASLLDEMPDDYIKESLVGDLIFLWVRTDPKAAYEWYKNLNQNLKKDKDEYYMDSLLSELAKKEPEYTWDLINASEDPNLKQRTIIELARGWVSKDPAAAFDWLESIATDEAISPSMLNRCYCSAMTKYMELAPTAAAQVVMELESESLQAELAEPAVRHLAEENLGKAMDWILQLNNPMAREAGMNELISSYCEEQPEAVLDYILQNSDLSESGINQISTAFSTASELYPELVSQISYQVPEQARAQVINAITENWLYQDESMAIEWLNSQPVGPSLDAGATAAAQYYLYKDPDAAFSWANKITNPDARSKLLNGIIDNASIDHLSDIYYALNAIPLEAQEHMALLAKLDQRLNKTYTTLILP